MFSARLTIDPTQIVAAVPRRLFGTFVEHMGRSVYEGIYEPGHPLSDEAGFRGDVLALVRELGATTVRYPGGNFVSGHRWEDGVGPRDERPVRLDAAWHSTETNQVGLHEFAGWAASAGLELMYAVNLGTRGLHDAADVLEYANHPSGTALAERRRANGADEPFGIRLWCLGNEMDGPWQIGHKTADEYGRLAAETARLMTFLDPTIELVAAGSSNAEMPTFGEWERTVLRHTAGLVHHLSLHAYYEEVYGDAGSFLASGTALDRYIERVAEIIDEAGAGPGSAHPVGISVDEWNVWYQRRWNDVDKSAVLTGDWPEHPRLIEDAYSVTDAVVVGSLLNSLIRHSDRVTMASLAQLVNVIAPIRCEPGGPAWRQTIFFPFARAAALAGDRLLDAGIAAPSYDTAVHGPAPLVDAAVTASADGTVTVFVTNRSTTDASELTVSVAAGGLSLARAETLTVPPGGDRFTVNDAAAQPVGMTALDGAHLAHDSERTTMQITVPALSWSVLQLAPTAEGAR
ncbi:alpha-N-arabinofuranosidase [Microbacterium sp. CFBP9034]|uniref:arabinosylfuranosidase ArfA n=1 Tax=Microbacterium sp. CFBP9034 TaxID=3096540 RepID=UPI002A6AF81E|nr:alpha-L-arabinofuranosidase C-terminal domain-containing protein [Microbacterium sp. CFBP9034]MDY0908674.1 alpha-L-arabinofuranosidase C-terminal domain-containing protein [Microbacterium sp. CFBP9034]